MNFNHLEYAVAISRYGSIRKASQNLFVSQPYLSGIMKNLENELGYQIFSRTSSGITLTRNGEEFIKSAKRILSEVKKIRELSDMNAETPLNISTYHAPYIMEQFLNFQVSSAQPLPDRIREYGNMEVIDSVSSGETDLGILYYASDKKDKYERLSDEAGLRFQEFFSPMEIFAFLSPSHPLAERESLLLSELQDYPFVLYGDDGSQKYLKIRGLQEHRHLLTVSDRGGFNDAINSGKYISVMAYREKPENMNYVILPFLDKKLFLCSSYILSKNRRLTSREKTFLAFIRE